MSVAREASGPQVIHDPRCRLAGGEANGGH